MGIRRAGVRKPPEKHGAQLATLTFILPLSLEEWNRGRELAIINEQLAIIRKAIDELGTEKRTYPPKQQRRRILLRRRVFIRTIACVFQYRY